MSRNLDWNRAKRDSARSRRYVARRGEKPLPKDRGKPPSDKQLGYVESLRGRLGRTGALPETAYAASVEIDHLKRLLEAREQT